MMFQTLIFYEGSPESIPITHNHTVIPIAHKLSEMRNWMLLALLESYFPTQGNKGKAVKPTVAKIVLPLEHLWLYNFLM